MASQKTASRSDLSQQDAVTVRFAGDSGDGMQLTGGQFTLSTALAGNDLATFPDFPAEIRAPQGTLFGVSAFQINFGAREVDTAGDTPDVLVAMNPAALKTNLPALKVGGLVIIDTGEFTKRNLDKAKYDVSPLDDDTLAKYDTLQLDISDMTLEAVKPFGLGKKEALRCKNMWTLGLALWMFDRDARAACKNGCAKNLPTSRTSPIRISPRSTRAMLMVRRLSWLGHCSKCISILCRPIRGFTGL